MLIQILKVSAQSIGQGKRLNDNKIVTYERKKQDFRKFGIFGNYENSIVSSDFCTFWEARVPPGWGLTNFSMWLVKMALLEAMLFWPQAVNLNSNAAELFVRINWEISDIFFCDSSNEASELPDTKFNMLIQILKVSAQSIG